MIFDKIFGKKDEKKESRSMHVSELDAYIETRTSELNERVEEETRRPLELIENSFSNIEVVIEDLESKELEEEVVKRLENITLTSQKKFCQSIKKALEKRSAATSLPTYPALRDYIETTQSVLTSMDKIRATHGRYLGIAFESSMKELGKEIKIVADALGLLSNTAGEIGEEWEALRDLRERYDEYRSLDEGMMQERIKALEEERGRIGNELSAVNDDIEQYKAGEAYTSYLELQERVREADKKAEELNNRIYGYIAPLKRDLKKLKKAADNEKCRMTSEVYHKIEEMLEAPVQSLASEDGDLPETKRMAEQLGDALRDGTLQEKDAKRNKTLEECSVILNGELDDLVKRYVAASERRDKIQDEVRTYSLHYLEELRHKKEQLEAQLQRIDERIGREKTANASSQERKQELETELQDNIERIDPNTSLDF
jgi:hypothetical protein